MLCHFVAAAIPAQQAAASVIRHEVDTLMKFQELHMQ
jgi:hypothetical protein